VLIEAPHKETEVRERSPDFDCVRCHSDFPSRCCLLFGKVKRFWGLTVPAVRFFEELKRTGATLSTRGARPFQPSPVLASRIRSAAQAGRRRSIPSDNTQVDAAVTRVIPARNTSGISIFPEQAQDDFIGEFERAPFEESGSCTT
jgi:hypothetical protein